MVPDLLLNKWPARTATTRGACAHNGVTVPKIARTNPTTNLRFIFHLELAFTNSFKCLAYSGNAALRLQQKSRGAKHFENISQLLILKSVVPRTESRLLRRAGLQPGHDETFSKRLQPLKL